MTASPDPHPLPRPLPEPPAMHRNGPPSHDRSGRFLRRRSARARDQAVLTVEVSVQRVAALVLNAEALAERMASAPVPADSEAERERRERVERLRAAVASGQRALLQYGQAAAR